MTTFTKGDKVAFEQYGALRLGTIQDVGNRLMGVMVNGGYEAIETDKLRLQTPAEKAGLKIGDIVVVGRGIACPHAFRVGEEARFEYDDRTQSPRFIQDGETQYLDLSEITIGRKPVDTRTPAQKAGIEVGDTVELLRGSDSSYFGSKFTKLLRDDSSSMPRFGDAVKSLWIELDDVRKVEGPRQGVSWSDAPEGATHYSMNDTHRARWHKLDENGQWSYYEDHRWKDYRAASYAYPSTQAAIPGVVVEVNPLNAVLAEVKALEAQISTLNREKAQLDTEKQDKLDRIKAAGFKVEGGKLVKSGKPMAEWQDGDRVRCITRDGRGLANIIVGGVYVVYRRGTDIAVIDGDGDRMRGCVERNCFEFHAAGTPDLSRIPAREWKAGDTIEAVEEGMDITVGKRYTVTDMCTLADLRVQFRDNVNFLRRRPVSEFKLVARAA